ncbi:MULTISPECIES: alpha/beta hydrolase [Methylomonas]|uniref:AB hydrolase-1 domain-containing protein n=1 Tax=Methylomonas koyamae TaxID=702114 RepID=A0A177NE62_9GAMM|nr:alpha/beta hydrolase [Methylomonas koyamae]OAI15340.1 hypothetical protein A1355_10635 [Methylomonas koyamae]
MATNILTLLRTIGRWTSRTIKTGLVLLTALLLTGSIYQHFAVKADLEKYPAPGQMVEVDGHPFHIDCTGSGPLTVILEGGAGASSLAWAWIQPEVAKSAKVCSYDRAGYSWSAPSELPMDAINTSRQLHSLLSAANLPGPYILVGHSIGGAYVRMFAANYSQDVAGLVLVDATNPSVLETYAEVDLPKVEDWTPPTVQVFPYLASVGAMRAVLGLGLFNLAAGLPADTEATANAFLSQTDYLKTVVWEYRFLPDTLKQIRSLKPLNDLPVAIIVAGQFTGLDAETAAKFINWHQKQQRNWLDLSKNSSLRTIEEADHISLMTNHRHAHEVAKTIIEMVKNEGLKRMRSTTLLIKSYSF